MSVFNHFQALLGRMSVGRKLTLIYLLDLTAVIFISGILISEKFIAIDFARKELQGNAYIAEVRAVLTGVARWGAVPGALSGAVQSYAPSVTAAEQSQGAGLGSEAANAALASELDRARLVAVYDAAAAARVLNLGTELLTRVGNQSNLILDPDLDSYYTMSLIVLRYPELLEVVNGIRERLEEERDAGGASAELRARFLVLEGRLDASAKAIASDTAEASAAGGVVLRDKLKPPEAALQAALDSFRAIARSTIEDVAPGRSFEAAAAAQLALIDAVGNAWSSNADALEQLLLERIAKSYERMWLHLGTALALLLVVLTVVTVVAKSISHPLRHLSRVAEEVRRTGNQELRAVGHGSDETARLIGAFNDMLDQLGRERESQKELAASARAADAQRDLVHATPIALVVTSIPGHEVLHANPPAQRWLGGCSTDPWKTGMEPSVRSRFFQQLADRDHVDEFEVRWRIGDDAAWAVLSARRIQYQGQDAVLTAFAPINHLKLMERRLELWAKVFEASGEGILIVDAQRHIVTVNQAFTRHTGYDIQDVVGEKPSMVLPGIEAAGADCTLWAAVEKRGMWHGELSLRRRNGSEFPSWVMVNAVRQSHSATGHRGPPALGVTPDADTRGTEISHYIFTSIDISDRKKSEQRIQFLAEHDVLTELPNRSLCSARLRRAVSDAQRHGHQVAVLFIDLDRFKDINDTFGHHIGDSLLRSVARRLQESVRVGDTVSRLGGDEFVIVLSNVSHIDEVTQLVEQRVIPRIRAPHLINEAELHVSCSVGIAMYPGDADDIDTLMRNADTAMYQAKGTGKDRAQFYTAAMTERAQSRMRLEADLRRALELKQLSLYWQPRVRAQDGSLAGVEGLLRWRHPDKGMISPAEFIGVAEETGLIVPIGDWVIDEACRQITRWRAEGLPAMGVSINLSARQLRSDHLVDVVRDALQRNAVPPGMLELELTESMVMEDAEVNLRQMHALRALGVSLSIDDFGTGYSSLAYLNRFPIDKLKIDRSFVHTMLTDRTDRAITLAIIGLGHTLGLKVVAEGVEQIGEADLLREAKCDELQGYYYARPMPAGEIVAWSAKRQPEAVAA